MHRRTLLLFAFLAVAWGIPYLLIKIVVAEWDPSLLVFARTAGAALVLVPFARLRWQTRRVLRLWPAVLAYAAAEIAIPWFFLGRAEQTLPSSTTGLLLATVPLAGVGVGLLIGDRTRLSPRQFSGILVGLLGVVLLVGFELPTGQLGSAALMIVVVAGYAIGPAILNRWLPEVPGVTATCFALAIVAAAYLPVVTVRGGWPTQWPSIDTTASLVILIVVCSAGAFVALAQLIRLIGAVRATTVTYINPAVAMLAGAVVLGERISPISVGGFAIILLGCALVSMRSRASDPEPLTTVSSRSGS